MLAGTVGRQTPVISARVMVVADLQGVLALPVRGLARVLSTRVSIITDLEDVLALVRKHVA